MIRLLSCLLSAAILLSAQSPAPFEVLETTITQAHDAMRTGRLTCRELVRDYLKRIEVYDKTGPGINSIVIVNPEAEKQADELDRRSAVKRIKEAGALELAKSNMAEWAFTPYETVNSILPGYTRNPYALDRVTAGSSGGTAAAVAASFGLVGLGSDTGNSIRGPSSHQALMGIRSTMGLTSRAGVMPLNLLADIAGPMTRTVEDAAKVFVIVGEDPAR